MIRRFLLLGALLLAIIPAHAQDEPLQVAASFSILADVAANVAGDAANVTSVIPHGADPHSFTPAPRDIAALAESDVVLVNGMNFEEGLMEAIENADANMNIVTVSQCVEVLAFGGHDHEDHKGEDHDHEGEMDADDHEDEEMAADDHDHSGGEMSAIAALCAEHHEEMHILHEHEEEDHHEEGDDHDHEHETLGMMYEVCSTDHGHEHEETEEDHHAAESDEHAHEHGDCDPHVWTDPHNVILWTMMIRDTLIELDPTNAEIYQANAASYVATLDELSHDFYMPALASIPEENRKLVTNHEAFGYLAAAGDLDIVGVVLPGGSTLAEPSAGDIAALIEQINAAGVTAVFAETTATTTVAEQIANETGAQVYTLYSGSLSEDDTASTYIDFMRYNVTTIAEALGGSIEE